jgi:catechol 2,3-dioxygenase-like lactoylglutathione lyase family enzyme
VAVCGIDHVQLAIPVGGESLARRFYGELLGLTEITKPPNLAAREGIWFQCGPLQLHLGAESNFRPAKQAHSALLVSDLAGLLKTLTVAGCEVKCDSETVQGFDRAFTSDPSEIGLSSSSPLKNRSPSPTLSRVQVFGWRQYRHSVSLIR